MSSRIVKLAQRIAVRDKKLFDSLIEFEKTGKVRTKTRLNFTIDKDLALRFRKFCRDKGYNMSSRIEKCIEEIIG
ncbi:hypothetical protein KY330_00520 [Candidatus Woesearchaeota archaeon]|nr:hypothetical protein [Candidatus Woesearchaeota archaeon]